MKKLSLLLVCISVQVFSATSVFKGVYQGKNVYIQNPMLDNKKEYCVEEVILNNKTLDIKLNTAVFEINLTALQVGDSINIRLKHSSGCQPKLLNPQVIKINSAFKFLAFSVSASNLTWQTRGEKTTAKLSIEQFLNNNWVVVHEMPTKGLSTQNEYVYHEMHCSGINKYRIKYEEQEGAIFYSNMVEFRSNKPRVNFFPKKVTSIVKFSREVSFEVQDKEGNSVKKGYGNELDLSDVKEGIYYLFFDNKKEKITKK